MSIGAATPVSAMCAISTIWAPWPITATKIFELSTATAPLFKWAAHDDLHRQTYLESCIKLLDDQPDVVLAHSGTTFIDECGAPFPFDRATGDHVDPRTGIRQRPDSTKKSDHANAVVRFWQVLSGARWGTHMFGVIRARRACDKPVSSPTLPAAIGPYWWSLPFFALR